MKQLLRNKMLPIAAFMGLLYVAGSCLFVAQPLSAQVSGSGSVEGTVTDPSGAVIAGATVTCTSTATGISVTKTTTSSGFYVVAPLNPGDYTVEFKAQGFGPVRQEYVVVQPIEVTGLNMSLKVGSATAEVTVTTAPPALDTENGTLDAVLPAQAYETLPVAMNSGPKSPLAFTSILPTAHTDAVTGAYYLDGGSQGSSVIYMNGLPVMDMINGGALDALTSGTSSEVVSESQVILSGIPASYSGTGVINVVSKSGSNQFHGDVYENVRNTVFDSAPYLAGGKVPLEQQNEYGFSVGGPAIKNRLFFFFNLDRYKLNAGSNPTLVTIPTAAEQGGDFSALPITIYDPTTTYVNANGTTSRCAFGQTATVSGGTETCSGAATNVIPSGDLSNASKVLQAGLPTPTNSGLSNNYAGVFTNGSTQNMYDARVDYAITQNHHAYFLMEKGLNQPLDVSGSGGMPLPYGGSIISETSMWLGQIGESWTIKSNLVNVLSMQFDRLSPTVVSQTAGANWAAKAGLTGLPSSLTSASFPSVQFEGGQDPAVAWGTPGGQPVSENEDMYTYQDNVQWTKGKHSFTFGGQLANQHIDTGAPNGTYFTEFDNTETSGILAGGAPDTANGDAYASYLLGDVGSSNLLASTFNVFGMRFRQWAIWAQDDWKLTPKLTLNLGLRYNLIFPQWESQNHQSFINTTLPDPAANNIPGGLQFAGNGTDGCNCRTLVKTHPLDFDPRVGFAYALNPKTVVRGSFGITHFLGGGVGPSNLNIGSGAEGYSANPYFKSPDGGITPAFNWNNGYPGYPPPPFFNAGYGSGYNTTTGPTGTAPYYTVPATGGRPPYAEMWNFTVERELAPSVVWNLTYAGDGSHLLDTYGGGGADSNTLNPGYFKLGGLLTQAETPATLAAAQAIMPGISLPYPTFDGSIGQMLLKFPQYGAFNNFGYTNFGSQVYHSLVTSVSKKMSNGLYLLGSYVWSKNLGVAGGAVSWTSEVVRDQYNLGLDRSYTVGDFPNAFKLAWVYDLPAGRGHKIGGQNALMDALLSNWRVAGLNNYTDGNPIGNTFGGIVSGVGAPPYSSPLGNTGVPIFADYNPNFHGHARMGGKISLGNGPGPYLNAAAFKDPAPYTYGNTPKFMAYKGMRNPWSKDEDANVSKEFKFTERLNLRLQVDAFNLFNRTTLGGINANIDSSTFGDVGGQVNSPRQLQFEAYIRF